MISLCMLVKNEAQRLKRCLEHISLYVEQIVIVDTGSTDGTQEIVHAMGADLQQIVFTDFAQARNVALNDARENWVLVLDPDEEIEESSLQHLILLTKQNEFVGYRIPRYDYIGQLGWGLSHPCRLFQRLPQVYYRQPVYEEPVFPNRLAGQITTCWDIALHHYGYRGLESDLAQKRTLYTQLINRAGQDPAGVYKAQAYFAADAGDMSHALDLMTRYTEMLPGHLKQTLALDYARILLAAGRGQQAIEQLEIPIRSPDVPLYQRSRMENLCGLAWLRLDRQQEAAQAFQNAVNYGFPIAAYYANLGLAQVCLGLEYEGMVSLSQAVRLNVRLASEALRSQNISRTYQDHWLHRLDTGSNLVHVATRMGNTNQSSGPAR